VLGFEFTMMIVYLIAGPDVRKVYSRRRWRIRRRHHLW